MNDDPIEAVRALERQIAERLAAASGPARTVQEAHTEADAIRDEAARRAEHVAADRAEAILRRADEHAAQVRADGRERAERLLTRAQEREADDVQAVLAVVLPGARQEGPV